MALEKLDLVRLAEMDHGKIGRAFGVEMARVLADCEDVPANDKPRKITLTVSVRPVANEDGILDSCDIDAQCKSTLPARQTRRYNAVSSGGSLHVNDLSAENARQGTIDEPDGPKVLRRAEGGDA